MRVALSSIQKFVNKNHQVLYSFELKKFNKYFDEAYFVEDYKS